jgi:hypothetical protein
MSALEEEECDDAAVLATLPVEELEDLANKMGMKVGARKKLLLAVKPLRKKKEQENKVTEEEHNEQKKEPKTAVHKPDSVILPANKDYFAFLSHKKKNSKLGSATEGLALRVKDHMEHNEMETFFDGKQHFHITIN